MQAPLLVKDLLTSYTFDVPSKTMAARELLKDKFGWGCRTYRELLHVWNRFQEGDKHDAQDFFDAFVDILDDMSTGGFDWERSPIPTYEGRICNGRHRLAAALVLDQHVRTKETGEGPCDVDYGYFLAMGLNPIYADTIAIEFCRLKPESRIAVIFGEHDRKAVRDALGIEVFYEKHAYLKGAGPFNLIQELYLGEDWLPFHGKTKAELCYSRLEGEVTFLVLDVKCTDFEVRAAKERVRMMSGHHAIHINDTHEQTMRLAQALLNDNGIHFLNNATGDPLKASDVRRPGVAVDSGSVLAAYGLRLSDDIDYVDDPMHREHHDGAQFDDPRNFFWARGVKYASVPAVRRMKLNRGEAKDLRDVELLSWLK